MPSDAFRRLLGETGMMHEGSGPPGEGGGQSRCRGVPALGGKWTRDATVLVLSLHDRAPGLIFHNFPMLCNALLVYVASKLAIQRSAPIQTVGGGGGERCHSCNVNYHPPTSSTLVL